MTVVDVQDLAGDERRRLEVEDPVGDVSDPSHPAQMSVDRSRSRRVDQDAAGAYAVASERVRLASPPSSGRQRGRLGADDVVDELLVMLTTWPLP
ncbi:MAG: hypothetical protein WBP81_03220 [Solirubrobacteraceae bacterium]